MDGAPLRQSSAKSSTDASRSFEESCCRFVASMAAASPEVVRGIPLFRLVRLAPLYWLRGELQRLHHRSEVVTEFDEFWSHSWQASAGSKCINILMRTNGVPAFLLSMVSVMLATLLARLEILHPRDRFGAAWCVLLGSLEPRFTTAPCCSGGNVAWCFWTWHA